MHTIPLRLSEGSPMIGQRHDSPARRDSPGRRAAWPLQVRRAAAGRAARAGHRLTVASGTVRSPGPYRARTLSHRRAVRSP
eukprot:756667-Hanusia_phi.AAC.1